MNLHYLIKSIYPGYEIEITGNPANDPSEYIWWRFEFRREWPNAEGIFEPPDVQHCYTPRLLQLLITRADPAELKERKLVAQLADAKNLAAYLTLYSTEVNEDA